MLKKKKCLYVYLNAYGKKLTLGPSETAHLLHRAIDYFTRCKQHWSRNTSCFSL